RPAPAEAPEPAGRSPTKCQRRAMERGIAIHYFQWYKLPGPRRSPPAPAGEIPMPTLTLRGEVAEGEPFRGFAPVLFREQHEGVDVFVKLEALYRKSGEQL